MLLEGGVPGEFLRREEEEDRRGEESWWCSGGSRVGADPTPHREPLLKGTFRGTVPIPVVVDRRVVVAVGEAVREFDLINIMKFDFLDVKCYNCESSARHNEMEIKESSSIQVADLAISHANAVTEEIADVEVVADAETTVATSAITAEVMATLRVSAVKGEEIVRRAVMIEMTVGEDATNASTVTELKGYMLNSYCFL